MAVAATTATFFWNTARLCPYVQCMNEEKGRNATKPVELGRHAWIDILIRVWRNAQANQIPLVAAGIAFYSLLSLFPSIAAAVSIWGLFADPQTITAMIDGIGDLLPPEALAIIRSQASELAGSRGQTLGWGLFFSLALALFGASRSVKGFIMALNNIYRENEKRNVVILTLFAFALTLGLIVTLLIMVAAILVSPNLLAWIGIPGKYIIVYQLARWSVLIAFATLAIAILYRYGPSRRKARWHWVTGGAFIATVLWIVITAAFSFYVANFATYNETYGSLGAVVILLMWLWLSALVILTGGILDAEMEHQTGIDTTVGRDRPPGKRGAWVADHMAGEEG